MSRWWKRVALCAPLVVGACTGDSDEEKSGRRSSSPVCADVERTVCSACPRTSESCLEALAECATADSQVQCCLDVADDWDECHPAPSGEGGAAGSGSSAAGTTATAGSSGDAGAAGRAGQAGGDQGPSAGTAGEAGGGQGGSSPGISGAGGAAAGAGGTEAGECPATEPEDASTCDEAAAGAPCGAYPSGITCVCQAGAAAWTWNCYSCPETEPADEEACDLTDAWCVWGDTRCRCMTFAGAGYWACRS